MNLYALIIGIIIAIYVVTRFRKTRLEKKNWIYPVLLATFPVYYWVFAVYALDYSALVNEITIGIGFIAISYAGYRLNNYVGILLLATGYIGHAIYDVIHNSIFYNSGTPKWWPEFCGALDILIGLYLLYFAFSMKSNKTVM